MLLHICKPCRIITKKLQSPISSIWNRGIVYAQNTTQKNFKINALFSSQQRTYAGFIRKPSIEELKIKDNVPDWYKLIYKSKMDRYLLLTQIVLTSCSVCFILFMIYTRDLKRKISSEYLGNRKAGENDIIIMTAIFTLSLIGYHFLLSKMPVRIYNFPQKKEYKLIFYGNLPLSQKSLTCKVSEIVESQGGILPWKESRFLLTSGNEERHIFLFHNYFKRPADLYIMMGLQNDPDEDIEE